MHLNTLGGTCIGSRFQSINSDTTQPVTTSSSRVSYPHCDIDDGGPRDQKKTTLRGDRIDKRDAWFISGISHDCLARNYSALSASTLNHYQDDQQSGETQSRSSSATSTWTSDALDTFMDEMSISDL